MANNIFFLNQNSFLTLNLQEWPKENFSLQYQYNIEQRSDENKVKYQLGDY